MFAFQNMNTGLAPFGAGCSGRGVQVPTLQAIGSPTRGNAAFALRLHSTTGSVQGAIWFDGDRTRLSTAPLPLDLAPFGAPGCALLMPPTFLSLDLIDASGTLTCPCRCRRRRRLRARRSLPRVARSCRPRTRQAEC